MNLAWIEKISLIFGTLRWRFWDKCHWFVLNDEIWLVMKMIECWLGMSKGENGNGEGEQRERTKVKAWKIKRIRTTGTLICFLHNFKLGISCNSFSSSPTWPERKNDCRNHIEIFHVNLERYWNNDWDVKQWCHGRHGLQITWSHWLIPYNYFKSS